MQRAESIYTWTIGSLSGNGARGQNLILLLQWNSFMLLVSRQRASRKLNIRCSVGIYSMTSNPRVRAQGSARGQNLAHPKFYMQVFQDSHLYQKTFTLGP